MTKLLIKIGITEDAEEIAECLYNADDDIWEWCAYKRLNYRSIPKAVKGEIAGQIVEGNYYGQAGDSLYSWCVVEE
jgi:hypothetical protein